MCIRDSSKDERDALRREEALRKYPIGTHVRRGFADASGKIAESAGIIFDFREPYWRVRHPDGDWEELNEREVIRGKAQAEQHEREQRS